MEHNNMLTSLNLCYVNFLNIEFCLYFIFFSIVISFHHFLSVDTGPEPNRIDKLQIFDVIVPEIVTFGPWQKYQRNVGGVGGRDGQRGHWRGNKELTRQHKKYRLNSWTHSQMEFDRCSPHLSASISNERIESSGCRMSTPTKYFIRIVLFSCHCLSLSLLP